MTRLWILGAADPEMQAIEALLRECGETVAYATDDLGYRVTPRNMYCATHVDTPDSDPVDAAAHECYLVECAVDGLPDSVTIDHHRPGDPGYGRSPAEFLEASSLGQVIAELARLGTLAWHTTSCHVCPERAGVQWIDTSMWNADPFSAWVVTARASDLALGGAPWAEIPPDLVLTAAADHCLGAAYRGECPGVDPDALMRFRAAQRAAFQGRAVADILADITATQAALQAAPVWSVPLGSMPHTEEHDWSRSVCGGCRGPDGSELDIRDMRREDADGGPWPELPEAATRLGVGYVSGPLVGPDGRKKFTCSGTLEQVAGWLRWAEDCLVGVYGDPSRGFAGGYQP